MSAALIALATEIGAPIIRKILSDRIGPGNARLAESVAEAVAERAGIRPADIDDWIRASPDVMREAVLEVEARTPEMIALYVAETEARQAILLAETAKGGWQAAWRPAGMYLMGFLWLWNIVLLHVANAIWKIALPPVDFSILLQLSAAYMGLYMGGHTVKETVRNWKGAR
ncbi:hypothetical protein KX928_12695 [Roseobacter sp. YSTF-M11]|uniref:Holin of 3TMs, for gene-transfer release n=1 Tax=Roseobacter insulae TaxID=2859783 RepID=A0A9X1K2L4_9RHOB|nr:hypothetical protein [Roseobacter insulae]MBW4708643.1 hypothetical protein [Roseobacter insulae]